MSVRASKLPEFAAYTPYLYSTYEKPFYKIPPFPLLAKGGRGDFMVHIL
jgi:hypothetical protein